MFYWQCSVVNNIQTQGPFHLVWLLFDNNESSEFRMALECSLGFLYGNIVSSIGKTKIGRQISWMVTESKNCPNTKPAKLKCNFPYYEHTLLHSHSQVMINSLDHILSNYYEVFYIQMEIFPSAGCWSSTMCTFSTGSVSHSMKMGEKEIV